MNQNNLLKYLVPIVALVVLVESVLLISNLRSKNAVSLVGNVTMPTGVTESKPMAKPRVYDLTVNGPTAMKVGVVSAVEVNAKALTTKSLDSVNVYLKYDPIAFEISNLTFGKGLPAPTFSKVSTSKGLVVVNYLITAPNGVSVSEGQMLSLIKLDVKPKTAGSYVFELSTGNGVNESATMFVENATSEILPFTSNQLMVNTTR